MSPNYSTNLERILANSAMLKGKYIFDSLQSFYLPYLSTETALHKIADDTKFSLYKI